MGASAISGVVASASDDASALWPVGEGCAVDVVELIERMETNESVGDADRSGGARDVCAGAGVTSAARSGEWAAAVATAVLGTSTIAAAAADLKG